MILFGIKVAESWFLLPYLLLLNQRHSVVSFNMLVICPLHWTPSTPKKSTFCSSKYESDVDPLGKTLRFLKVCFIFLRQLIKLAMFYLNKMCLRENDSVFDRPLEEFWMLCAGLVHALRLPSSGFSCCMTGEYVGFLLNRLWCVASLKQTWASVSFQSDYFNL